MMGTQVGSILDITSRHEGNNLPHALTLVLTTCHCWWRGQCYILLKQVCNCPRGARYESGEGGAIALNVSCTI